MIPPLDALPALLLAPEGSGRHLHFDVGIEGLTYPRERLLLDIAEQRTNERGVTDRPTYDIRGILAETPERRLCRRGKGKRGNTDGFFFRLDFTGCHEVS